MVNAEQARIIFEISNNKKLYLSMAEKEQNYHEIQILYEKFSTEFMSYYNKLSDEVFDRMAYKAALKRHKVDPYIAGGIGQGIGGVGAGIYAARSTAARNAQIDANRAYYKEKVFDSSSATSAVEENLLFLTKNLDALLDSINEIREYRKKEIEKIYFSAKELSKKFYSKKNREEAEKKFKSIENYKDSKDLAEKCKSNGIIFTQSIIFLCSFIPTVFFWLMVEYSEPKANAPSWFWVMMFLSIEIVIQLCMFFDHIKN